MLRSSVPFAVLFKVMAAVSLPSLIVMSVLVVMGYLDLFAFLVSYLITLILSFIYVYPFLCNIMQLTHYVSDLAKDKKASQPKLPHISMMFELSHELQSLQNLWEKKREELQKTIIEREVLVDALPDIIIIIDSKQHILRTNRATRQIFSQNLAGKKLEDIIPSSNLIDTVTRAIEGGSMQETEFHIEEPMYRDFLAIIEHLPIEAQGGGGSLVVTMNDITELKGVEKMRADFVANASHEIRTPLASIIGFIETIQGPAKDDPEAIEQFLDLMSQQAERMRQLINDLLSLSKIEMNAHSIPIDPVNFAQVINSEARHFELPAKEKGMSILLDVKDTLPLVKGDKNELAQIVHNLIGNAIKYGDANTEVRVVARVTSDLPPDQYMRTINRAVMLSVRDQGEGIAKEHLARLTERFFRVDSSRTQSVGGTGLGLAIVKGILTRHRGAITINSTIGQGSSFNVFLPLYEDY